MIIAMLACSAATFAQADTPEVTKVSTEINNVVNNIFDKTTEAVKGMADALKVPAEHVYTVIVKQQLTKSVTWTIVYVLLLIVCLWLWYLWLKDDGDDKLDWIVVPILATIIYIILISASLTVVISGYFNPEYGAIKEIVELIK